MSGATANTIAGTYFVNANVSGVAAAPFSLTNLVGPPVSITTISGTPQTTAPGAAFALPLQAVVKDQYGNVVPGVQVTFTAGGAGTFPGNAQTTIATTGLDGVATSPLVSAGTNLGTFPATAQALGVSTPASFSLIVAGITTSTNLSVSPSGSANFGQQVTLTAILSPNAATGIVSFYDGASLIGSGPISGGVAVFKTILLGVGSHLLHAVFPQTGSYLGSTSNSVPLAVHTVPGVSFLPGMNLLRNQGVRIVAADLNRDGIVDFVVLNSGAYSVGQ